MAISDTDRERFELRVRLVVNYVAMVLGFLVLIAIALMLMGVFI